MEGIWDTCYVDFVHIASWNVILISFANFECSMSGFSEVYIFLKRFIAIENHSSFAPYSSGGSLAKLLEQRAIKNRVQSRGRVTPPYVL